MHSGAPLPGSCISGITVAVGILRGPVYYIAGPPTRVAAVSRTLSELSVDEDDVGTEQFAGY